MLKSHHHANLLVGYREDAESYLNDFCRDCGIKLANNPDFFAFRIDTFGIDEARQLNILSTRKAFATMRDGQMGKKIFFIAPLRLTLEAQNALLKTFVDPPSDSIFFLVIQEEGMIVPTLLSRMQTVKLSKGKTSQLEEAKEFLSSSLKKRLLFAKDFADEEKSLPTFLDDLLLLLRKKNGSDEVLEKVYNLRRLINDSNLTPRLVIEHLSLML